MAASVRRELDFYRLLPRHAGQLVAQSGRRAPAIGTLLVLWQLANAAGFAWEVLRSGSGRPSPTP